MTARALALIAAAIISLGSLVMLEGAAAQDGTVAAGCTNACDCNFECLDFCSSDQCLRSSACKRRVEGMRKQCQKICKTCNTLKSRR
ncbi:MAG: hypothetical protein R3D62_15230 [Xanthobacteraceae bacterium]